MPAGFSQSQFGDLPEQAARLQTALADRYAFGRELGRGGMATVYLATDLKTQRQVAVKVLRPELTAAVSRERFQREINIVAHLRHPHILPLFDAGVVDRTSFFIMPYVQGETLRARLDREGQFPIEDAVRLACEIADALAYAHAQNIVHRDIKPQNIMLEAGHAVVADFGIAVVTDDLPGTRLTETGFSLGSPHYMSPEQATAARRVDGRTDIYSLGCVLYEMLTGTPPFTGADVFSILARHAAEQPPSIRVVRNTVSEFLESVTFQAMAKSPADRYATAQEFVAALTEVAHERVRQTAPGRTTIPSEPGRGHVGKETARTDEAGLGGSRQPAVTSYLIALATGLLLLTAVGFLNTTIYDVKLKVPSIYTPTRLDFPIVGLRALVPGIFVMFLLLILYVMSKHLLRFVMWLATRRSTGWDTIDHIKSRWPINRLTALTATNSTAKAEVWFLLGIVASALVLLPFLPLLASLTNDTTAPLSCSARSLHTNFTIATSALISVLLTTWVRVFRQIDSQADLGFTLVRWGGLAWIVALVLVMTAPWRLLWGENPRALLNGERVYLIQESATDLLLYNPEKGMTERLPAGTSAVLQPLGSLGYIFEGPQRFDDQAPRC